jgi:hypothetical protein
MTNSAVKLLKKLVYTNHNYIFFRLGYYQEPITYNQRKKERTNSIEKDKKTLGDN